MKVVVKNPSELEQVAHELLAHCQRGEMACIVALSGNLGAGKTTLTQMIAHALGITENVTSPTFIIEKIYKIAAPPFEQLIHIDAYRLEKPEELEKLGWHRIAEDPKNIIFIEWPEKVASLLPEKVITVTFTHINESTRELEIDYGQN